MNIFIKGESAWQFVTSSTGGIGVEFVAAEGGKIFLNNPQGKQITFYYGSAGVGLSAGLKLPKIGKVQVNVKGRSVVGAIAPAAFPNGGKLYILDTFAGTELTEKDIQGVCAFLEIGGGIIAGVSATAMLVGMNPIWLAGLGLAAAAGPAGMIYLDYRLLRSATGLLVMGGLNAGIQAGAGVGAFLGGLY
jgi:hypothetical protein